MIAASPACLTDDELLALAAGELADAPAAEAHLATCSTCSALLAAAVRERSAREWDALVGKTLGPYVLEAQIGAGGMGAVYRARDPRLERAVAVKVLTAANPAEARAAAAIEHPAIVRIYDVGEVDGLHYVAMELVEGESLRSALAAGPMAGARKLVAALVDALVAAHARGVIHRDLKPENIVLTRDGVRILDFGLARIDGAVRDQTEPGTIQGTAGYMAPEQARGEPADARADLFAVGAIAYELVTGRRAFPGATAADRLSATLRDSPTLDDPTPGSTADATVDPTLRAIIARCLAKDPRERFQTAADLAWALGATRSAPNGEQPARGERASEHGAPTVSRRGLIVGAGVAATTGLLGYVLGTRRRPAAAALPKLRPLTHRNGRVYGARFTRDGSRVVYGAAWDLDPIGVFVTEIETGDTHALDVPSADLLAVSSRDELALSVGHRFVDHQSARGHLTLLPLAGGVPRPLADDIQAADFSPTAPDRIAAIRAVETGFVVEFPLGTAIARDDGWLTYVRVSPDGGRVAYFRHPQTDDDEGALCVGDRVISDGWASLAGLAWDPRGDALWFTGSRDNLVSSLHRVTLAGDVTDIQVPSIGRMRLLDLAADRRALLTSDAWRLRSIAGERDHSRSEISYVADLSADASTVVMGELGDLDASNGTFLVPYAGGRALRLGPGAPVAISPSGKRVAANVQSATHLVVYSTDSADTPHIPTPGFVGYGRWLDEITLLVLWKNALWRIGAGVPVAVAQDAGRFALDGARARAAYVDPAGVLKVLVLATGAVTTLATPGRTAEVCGWLATGEIALRSTTTPIEIDRVDPQSGARTHHMTVQPPLTGLKAVDTLVLHPDGVHVAYSYGQEISQLFVATPLTRSG